MRMDGDESTITNNNSNENGWRRIDDNRAKVGVNTRDDNEGYNDENNENNENNDNDNNEDGK